MTGFEAEFEKVALPEDVVPERICATCAAGALFHHPTRTAAVYCQHALTGAVLPLGRLWLTVPGIERHVFVQMVSYAIEKALLTRDVGEALEQHLLEQAKGSTKH